MITRIASLLLLATVLGCGSPDPPPVVVNWGEIDKSLPAAQQELQTVMSQFLRAVQSGTDFKRLYTTLPEVIFSEPETAFYGEGVHLVRWDWTSLPQGNVVGVRLVMMLDVAPGDKTVEYQRTYKITKAGTKWTIARQSS